jgi:hypothetical protein
LHFKLGNVARRLANELLLKPVLTQEAGTKVTHLGGVFAGGNATDAFL